LVESFLLQALQQLDISLSLNNALALLLNLSRRLQLLIFEFPDFVARVQPVRIQAFEFASLHRRLPQHLPLALGTLSRHVSLSFPQRLQISSQLFQLQLFQRGLPGAPAPHAFQRKLKPFHFARRASSLNPDMVFSAHAFSMKSKPFHFVRRASSFNPATVFHSVRRASSLNPAMVLQRTRSRRN
jgi:hypothetical protein